MARWGDTLFTEINPDTLKITVYKPNGVPNELGDSMYVGKIDMTAILLYPLIKEYATALDKYESFSEFVKLRKLI